MPAVFELFGPYEMLKELGWWEGRKDKNGYGHPLEECIERGKPAYCDLSRGGKSGLTLWQEEPELVTRLANRLGFHFVLSEARYPATLGVGAGDSIRLTWENRGVARLFEPARVSFALLAPDGTVADTCEAVASRPAEWKPDQSLTVTETLAFSRARPGTYRLAVGIRRKPEDRQPSLLLGNALERAGNWQVLGTVRLGAGH
jgi:hypothetical protein